jgi:NTP pyrophosphatase (non-canonical NTP hydrolase)
MNRTEHLLVCLAEECAEVAKAVSKALRFGLDDGAPGSDATNAQDIAGELNDLVAVAELLEECGAIPRRHSIRDIEAKKAKVLSFLEYAERRGAVEKEDGHGV